MPVLNYILTKKFDETFIISFIEGPQTINDTGYIFKTGVINGIVSIKSFSDEPEGETEFVYFTKYYKYKNSAKWSEMIPIEQITEQIFDSCADLELELYYFRTIDGDYDNTLNIDNIIIGGEYAMSVYDSEAELPTKGDTVILAPSDIYKVFDLSGVQVQSTPHNSYDIKFRFTQDGGRTHTPWEPLTTENISTHKLSPIRFAQVEYSITNTGEQGLLIYDIILEGDFQNVSANYLKINRYGLKEDCLTALLATQDNTNRDFYTSDLSTYNTTDVTLAIENENIQNSDSMWNPYQFDKITQFSNMLGNQVSNIFGWNIDYHLTDPDGNGIDKYMHEYTLKNVTDVKQLKVIVPDNKFPVESLIINQFNLDMFDTFEIHIMKDAFKNTFGISKRPSEDDIIYICEANMLYYVKHSQAFKDIMNAATYYKVILEKYEYKTNIRNALAESKEQIDKLTNNTTIESLFGNDMKDEENKIANKEQTYPTSFDKIRQKISKKVTISKDDVYVDNFKIIKQYYDLSYNTIKSKTAVNYQKTEQNILKSDNRSFIFWFNFNDSFDEDSRPNNTMFLGYDIVSGVEFNLLNNYDNTNNKGYKIYYQGGHLFFKINENMYKLKQELMTNVWYAGVINLNQRQKNIDIKIYSRNTEITTILFDKLSLAKEESIFGSNEYINLIESGYKPVRNTEGISNGFTLVNSINYQTEPIEFTHTENLRLLGSNIKYSNLRILDEVIPTKSIENTLKEYILRDGQHIILADNATKQLITKNYYNKNFR